MASHMDEKNKTDLMMHLHPNSPLVRLAAIALIAVGIFASGRAAHAQDGGQYSAQEIVDAGHGFFGSASGGLANVVEKAFEQYGLPNGYILGQEGSGAFIAGLTYGEGQLYTIGRAHFSTPAPNAHLVSRLHPEKKHKTR